MPEVSASSSMPFFLQPSADRNILEELEQGVLEAQQQLATGPSTEEATPPEPQEDVSDPVPEPQEDDDDVSGCLHSMLACSLALSHVSFP